MAAVDVDSDSQVEVAVKDPRSVALLPRDQAGTLPFTPYAFAATFGGVLATGDFDQDFSPDVVTGEVEVLSNRGGYYPIGECLDSLSGPVAIEALDFLGADGHLDVVTINQMSRELRQYRGSGNSTFTEDPLLLRQNVGTNPVAVDGANAPSGQRLLVVADDGSPPALWVSFAPATGTGFPMPTQFPTGSFTPRIVALGNFDGPLSTPGNDVAVVGRIGSDARLRIFCNLPTPTHCFEDDLPDENVQGPRSET